MVKKILRKVFGGKSQSHTIGSSDLPFALYLNQRLVFDILATLRGGFAQFSTTLSTSTEGVSDQRQLGLGVNNNFALLQVGFKNSKTKHSNYTYSKLEDIVQTPTSLFAQLRKDLNDLKLIRSISNSSDLGQLQAGEFVEMEAKITRNPITEFKLLVSHFIPLMQIFGPGSTSKQIQSKHKNNIRGVEQMEEFLSAFLSDTSQDFVASIGDFRAVIVAENQYFSDSNFDSIFDGNFKIIGKVINILPVTNNQKKDDDQKISLLRQSALSRIDGVEEIFSSFIEETSLDIDFELEVRGPAVHVIPIAIFT